MTGIKKFKEVRLRIDKPRVDNTINYIKVSRASHWATKGINPKQFLVGGLFKWCIHKFNYLDEAKALTELAYTERGPSMLIRKNGEK